jgi:hypothetical protein
METQKKPSNQNANSISMNPNNNSSFNPKKVLPNAYKNPKKLYVSPYSQKMK